MIKGIKAWFTTNNEDSGKTLHVEVKMIEKILLATVLEKVHAEIVRIISDKFLEEHKETIKKEILNNPKFADAVYNAIVLKEANKI